MPVDEDIQLVDSFVKLAAALGKDRAWLYQRRYMPEAPEDREDGKFDVVEWRAYLDSLEVDNPNDEHDEEYKRLKREYLKIRTEKEKYALLERKGQLLTISEHLEEVREILEQAKWLTRTIPTRVALLTTDSVVRASVQNLCDHIATEFSERLISATEKEADARKAEQMVQIGKQENGNGE